MDGLAQNLALLNAMNCDLMRIFKTCSNSCCLHRLCC